MALELTALANHRKGLRVEIARASERFRGLQSAIDERAASKAGSGSSNVPLWSFRYSLSPCRILRAMEDVLGMSVGHEATLVWIVRFLNGIEEGAPADSTPD